MIVAEYYGILSKSQWIFTKFDINIVEMCFGIAPRQISSIFDSCLPTTW